MSTWLYIQSESALWTVGFYDPEGKWCPESDQGSPEDAAARVHWLNGGDAEVSTHSRQWVNNHPDEALTSLVEAGVLVKCYAVPDSPHVARGRFSWGLFANPGDRGKEDVVELWERVDTLPPLIGEEGPTVT